MKKDEEINVYTGETVFKGSMEYFAEGKWLFGYPYYFITQVNKMYYFWELDMTDPEKGEYLLLEKSENHSYLYEKARNLDDIKREEKRKKVGY